MKWFKKKRPENSDRRNYIRLDYILPVDIRLVDVKGKPIHPWRQGFTHDVSAGGIRLVVDHLTPEEIIAVEKKDAHLALQIRLSLRHRSIAAIGKICWVEKTLRNNGWEYAIGVFYERINKRDNNRIIRFVAHRRSLKAILVFLLIVVCGALILSAFLNSQLLSERNQLIKNTEINQRERTTLTIQQDRLKIQSEELKFLLSQSERRINLLKDQIVLVKEDAKKEDLKTISELLGSLMQLEKKRNLFQERLAQVSQKKERLDEDVSQKSEVASQLRKKISIQLRKWLKNHQNNRTGLVTSFEGDQALSDWAFTYDQALAVIVFVRSGDLARARQILDFYKQAKRLDEGGVANAYYASSGEVSEFIAHAGPNIWLALAVLQYNLNTNDRRYIKIAEDIALWLDTIEDKEGGLRGGKTVTWYSTEHNLDAYAFYQMLYLVTNKQVYLEKAQKTLAWLRENSYSTLSTPPVKRGKGDSTIATDTYAWSISAIGPAVLKKQGMDPDGIIEFAIDHCAVSVEFKRPDGKAINISGFDFAKYQNLPRGGIVSSEWTAQMVLALQSMADFHAKAQREEERQYYQQLSDFYVTELTRMVIVSPSPVGQGGFCLPYASHEFSDTGHGWRTPKGNRTGSVAGTAYTVLAIENYNPLAFNPGDKSRRE